MATQNELKGLETGEGYCKTALYGKKDPYSYVRDAQDLCAALDACVV